MMITHCACKTRVIPEVLQVLCAMHWTSVNHALSLTTFKRRIDHIYNILKPRVDHMQTTHWQHAKHVLTTSNHAFTTCYHAFTIYKPRVDHIQTSHLPHANHVLTTSNHILTTCKPRNDLMLTTHLPHENHAFTTCNPRVDHIQTTHLRHAKHVLTTCKPRIDHMQTTQSLCDCARDSISSLALSHLCKAREKWSLENWLLTGQKDRGLEGKIEDWGIYSWETWVWVSEWVL